MDTILITKIIIFSLFIITFMWAFSLAPFVPTRKNDVKRITDIISMKSGERFIEIGCGTARITLAMAKKYPNNQFTWVELWFGLFLISYLKAKFQKLKNVNIIWGNVLKHDFSNYEVLYIFWMPETMTKKLLPKMEKKLKQWARFYSYCMQLRENDIFTEKRIKSKDQELAVYEYIKK